MELVTERCLIRNLNIEDADELYRVLSDEETKKLVEHAKCLDADSCVIECDAEQIASKRIALKNGFVYEGKSDDLERYRLAL